MASDDPMNVDPAAGGDDDDSSVEGEQIRVTFVLDASVSDRTLEVPVDPIAVPSSVRRRGLSAVINHLLDRRVTRDDDDDEQDSDEEEDGDKLPAVPFDFLVGGRLLRTGVEAAARREALSLERAVEVRYFPASKAPEGGGESEDTPDWITALSYAPDNSNGGGGGGGAGGWLCSGGGDGSLRAYAATSGGISEVGSVGAHAGPVKCVAGLFGAAGGIIASGSLDQTLLTHVLDSNVDDDDKKLALHASYEGGHFNSICSAALLGGASDGGGGAVMASGDWDGGLCVWDVPAANGAVDDPADAEGAAKPSKKKKKSSSKASSASSSSSSAPRVVRPKISFKAHASNVSGIAYSRGGANTLLTGSWDHSVKVWDVSRQDCLLTLNGSRVVTSMGRCPDSDVLATGHPDCAVRLWDVRTGKGGKAAGGSSVSDTSLKPSHKAWVSAVQWSQTNPYVLATTSHDGTVKTWDVRSSLPLHTIRAHPKGEKGLCLAFGDGAIYSGGTDRRVKRFVC